MLVTRSALQFCRVSSIKTASYAAQKSVQSGETALFESQLPQPSKYVVPECPHERKALISKIDAEIKRLQHMRAMVDGSVGTLRWKFLKVSREYGLPFLIWWWIVWGITGAGMYYSIDSGLVDTELVLKELDDLFNTSLQTRIDPELGKIGVALALNELFEPVRLPFVIMSTPAVVRASKRAGIV